MKYQRKGIIFYNLNLNVESGFKILFYGEESDPPAEIVISFIGGDCMAETVRNCVDGWKW